MPMVPQVIPHTQVHTWSPLSWSAPEPVSFAEVEALLEVVEMRAS